MKILLGKPKIEFCESVDGVPDNNWVAIDTPKEDSTTLETQEGNEITATEEGGEVVERLTTAASYTLSFELFQKKNTPMLFENEDVSGVVPGEYAFRVSSDIDPTAPGYRIDRATVKCQKMYAPNDTYRTQFSVAALKPAAGATVKTFAEVSTFLLENGSTDVTPATTTATALTAVATTLVIEGAILQNVGQVVLGIGSGATITRVPMTLDTNAENTSSEVTYKVTLEAGGDLRYIEVDSKKIKELPASN